MTPPMIQRWIDIIDGIHASGVDMVTWDDAQEIVFFKVMLRPIKGLRAIIPRMAEPPQPT
jgi:hypothetical protein